MSAPSPAELSKTPLPKSLLSEIWTENRDVFKALTLDAILFLYVLLILAAAHWVLTIVPYPDSRKEIIGTLHFWAYVVVTIIFLLDMVHKLFLCSFERKHD